MKEDCFGSFDIENQECRICPVKHSCARKCKKKVLAWRLVDYD